MYETNRDVWFDFKLRNLAYFHNQYSVSMISTLFVYTNWPRPKRHGLGHGMMDLCLCRIVTADLSASSSFNRYYWIKVDLCKRLRYIGGSALADSGDYLVLEQWTSIISTATSCLLPRLPREYPVILYGVWPFVAVACLPGCIIYT